MNPADFRKLRRRNKLTGRQMRAALLALEALQLRPVALPEGVTNRDVEGAVEKLRTLLSGLTARELIKLHNAEMWP